MASRLWSTGLAGPLWHTTDGGMYISTHECRILPAWEIARLYRKSFSVECCDAALITCRTSFCNVTCCYTRLTKALCMCINLVKLYMHSDTYAYIQNLDSKIFYCYCGSISLYYCFLFIYRSPQTDYAKQVKFSVHVQGMLMNVCTRPLIRLQDVLQHVFFFPFSARMVASLSSSSTELQRCQWTLPSGTIFSLPPSKSGTSGSTNKTGSMFNTQRQMNCW